MFNTPTSMKITSGQNEININKTEKSHKLFMTHISLYSILIGRDEKMNMTVESSE